MIILILLLWLALVLVLLHATYRAYARDRKTEMVILLIITVGILFATGEYALFFGWSVLCDVGLLSCIL